MNGPQCECGWFLADAHAIATSESLVDVRGDCKRCGPNVRAMQDGEVASWWWMWEAWHFDDAG